VRGAQQGGISKGGRGWGGVNRGGRKANEIMGEESKSKKVGSAKKKD